MAHPVPKSIPPLLSFGANDCRLLSLNLRSLSCPKGVWYNDCGTIMWRTQVVESGRQEEQRRAEGGLSKAVIIALFIWFTIISFLFTGYGHI
jgi:hypothetical protein